MEKDYTPIMSKGKLNLFDIFKQSLTIATRNSSFTILSFLTSLPFFIFLIFLELILHKVLLETSKHRSAVDSYEIYLFGEEVHETPKVNLFLEWIKLCLLYLIPYQLLEFLSIITIVPAASMVYAAEKPVNFRDMIKTPETSFKGPFITSIYVHLLSTTITLGSAGFLINCGVMVLGFENQSYFDVLVAIVRGVGFTALFVKFLEWSSGWNMALVISILEKKFHGVEALKFSAYVNQDFSQRGLVLMLVFFVWGLVIRLPCVFYGYNIGGLGSVLFTCAYTLLICLGNLMKWVVCVVYYFDCKKGVLEINVDDAMEVGKDVSNNVVDDGEVGKGVAYV